MSPADHALWHPGIEPVGAEWAVAVPLRPDEILSSWLVRAALANGCDPMVVTGSLWPGWRAWTRDIDRHCPAERLDALAERCGLPASAFEAATLEPVSAIVNGGDIGNSRIWPWILAIGARSRQRFGGLQYCPACLAEDPPYFRLHWRLAWHTACASHGTALLDRCPHCAMPLAPHRLEAVDRVVATCAECGRSLADANAEKADCDALGFQEAADNAARSGSGGFGGDALPPSEWFAAARALATFVMAATRARTPCMARAVDALGVGGLPSGGAGPLELARTRDRIPLLAALGRLMRMGADGIAGALSDAGVSGDAFLGRRKSRSVAVARIAERLRPAKHWSRKRGNAATLARPNPRHVVERRRIRLMRRLRDGS